MLWQRCSDNIGRQCSGNNFFYSQASQFVALSFATSVFSMSAAKIKSELCVLSNVLRVQFNSKFYSIAGYLNATIK